MMNALANKIRRQDLMIGSSLFLLTLATRIPWATRMIYDADSVRFALAMEHFDVAQMRPHAPGYILYVGLAKGIDLLVRNARLSLLSVSIVASAMTLLILYFLAVKLYGRGHGVMSALLLLSSPLYWFNGEMAYTYALEGLLCTVFAACCYDVITGERKRLLIAAFVLGLATGVRQHIIIMLLPLWLFALVRSSLKESAISLLVFGLTCLMWFLPMMALTGGVERYFQVVDAQFKTWVLHPSPLLFQLKTRTKIFMTFMIYSLGVGLVPLLYYIVRFVRRPVALGDIRLRFLLLWLLPPVLFFIGINIYNPGHVVMILPPLFICLAESIRVLSRDLDAGLNKVALANKPSDGRFPRRFFSSRFILFSSVLLILLTNLDVFFFQRTPVSYAAIREGDRHLSDLVTLTRNNFQPAKSMILACWLNTQAGFYLPDYLVCCPFPLIFPVKEIPVEAQNVYFTFGHETNPKTYWIPTGFKIKPIAIPKGVGSVVLWNQEMTRYYQDSGRPLKEIDSNLDQEKIYYIRTKPGDRIYYHYHFFSIK
jgi:hypothetical protein